MDWDSFCVGGEELIKVSHQIGGEWQWEWRDSVHSSQKVGRKFLALTSDLSFEEKGPNTKEEEGEEAAESGEEDILEQDDDGCEFENGIEEFVFVEYHIVFSEIYACPVLYFQPRFQDGRVMNHNEIWSFLSLDEKSPGNMVTQSEHPATGFPFFFVHPCKTPQVMGAVLPPSQTQQEIKYLVCWLSLVGPVVRLRVPPEIATYSLSENK